MVQSPFPATALLTRLQVVFDDHFAAGVTAAPQHPVGAGFRNGMDDVFTLIVHETDGWPSRSKAKGWVDGFSAFPGQGVGPQTAISSDGTVTQVMGYPRVTWHAEFLNGRSLGTETGHGGDARGEAGKPAKPPPNPHPAEPPPDIAPDTSAHGVVRTGWHRLSDQDEDIPGAKLFCRDLVDSTNEVLICWWSSALYTTRTHADFLIPTRDPPGAVPQPYPVHIIPVPPHPTLMVFSEAQYRSWSLLARFLCETFLVPRNLLLYPWTNRDGNTSSPPGGGSPRFRQIVLADPNFTTIRDDLTANVASFNAAHNINNTIFTDANLAAFRTAYDNARVGAGTIAEGIFNLVNNNKALNKAWLYLFKSFRGIVGHSFAGAAVLGDHDCPGPMFDWYRFARELYDWWWYPFDFIAAFNSTATPKRAILTPRSQGTAADPGDETPLIEHFWENMPADNRPDPYLARATRPPGGLLGQTASPDTFRLEANTPVYAMANGELIAARIVAPGAGVNMSFVLIRHEAFHQADSSGMQAILAGITGNPPPAHVATLGRIDYTAEPTSVYSLYMHLGGGDQVNFDNPIAANPTWLNRVLVRKKECDLAIDAAGNLNAALQAMTAADFTTPPPAAAGRPEPRALLRLDKDRLTTFINSLRAGNVAAAPTRGLFDNFGPTPIKVLLSDHLGEAGITRVTNGVPSLGVLIEVFSPAAIGDASFHEVLNKSSWDPGATINPMIGYVGEWARPLNAQETAAVTAAGANPALMRWWSDAIANQFLQVGLAVEHKLPINGLVYHYAPLDFMRWLNGVTWMSEWPKYRVKDGGVDLALPTKPRVRRL